MLVENDIHEAEFHIAHAAGHLAPGEHIHDLTPGCQPDPARVEGVPVLPGVLVSEIRVVENQRILEEKSPFLGEEERESRKTDLAIIDLGLREARIGRHRGHHRGVEVVENIQAGFDIVFGGDVGDPLIDPRKGRRRSDGEPQALVDSAHPDQTSRHAEIAGETRRVGVRPADLLVVAPDTPGNIEAPYIRVRIEIERVIGDGNLDAPAPGVDGCLGEPEGLPVAVVGVALDEDIVARTPRVDLERVPVAVIVESIDGDDDAVVVPRHRIAQHQVGHDCGGVGVVTANAEIDEFPIRQDPNVRFLRRLGAGHRDNLQEPVDEASFLPYRIIEFSVDFGRRFRPSDAHARPSLLGPKPGSESHEDDEHRSQAPAIPSIHPDFSLLFSRLRAIRVSPDCSGRALPASPPPRLGNCWGGD